MRAGDTRFLVRTYAGRGAARSTREGRAPHGDTDRPLALLLHGWPQDGTCWRAVAPRLAQAGYRVVCPDLKGFGGSDAPRRGYDPATLSDEISQLVRLLDARKAVLVGHDWGGAVALSTAFRHPGRVRALVVASSPFRQIDLMAAWHIPLLNVPVVPQVAFKVASRPLTRGAITYAAVRQEPFTSEVVARYAAAVRERPIGWLSYYRRLSKRALWDMTVRRIRRRSPLLPDPEGPHRLRVPTSVVWGEQDPVTPIHLATQVADDLDARLVTIPDVGHFVHEEAPDAFADAVLDLAGEAEVGRDADGGSEQVRR